VVVRGGGHCLENFVDDPGVKVIIDFRDDRSLLRRGSPRVRGRGRCSAEVWFGRDDKQPAIDELPHRE